MRHTFLLLAVLLAAQVSSAQSIYKITVRDQQTKHPVAGATVDFSVFNARRLGRHGYTLLGSINYQREYDVDADDFTELPRALSRSTSPRGSSSRSTTRPA